MSAPLSLFVGVVITSTRRGTMSITCAGWFTSAPAARAQWVVDARELRPGEPILSTSAYDITDLSLEPRP